MFHIGPNPQQLQQQGPQDFASRMEFLLRNQALRNEIMRNDVLRSHLQQVDLTHLGPEMNDLSYEELSNLQNVSRGATNASSLPTRYTKLLNHFNSQFI